VLITVRFVAGAAFFGAGALFLMTVEPLPLLESLAARPRPTFGAGAAATALFPLPTPDAVVGSTAFLVAMPRVVLAFSTMFVRILAAPPDEAGTAGLSGEGGRDTPVLGGTVGRIGDLGSVREFADLGERTWSGWRLTRDVVRSGGCGGPRVLFFGFSMSSFSLSVVISSLGMY
jgi:hypothetical protein